jgi:hypothetical protein
MVKVNLSLVFFSLTLHPIFVLSVPAYLVHAVPHQTLQMFEFDILKQDKGVLGRI